MENMTLSAGEFERIMAGLRSEERGNREKRQTPRVGLRMQLRIIIHSGSAKIRSEMVWLRDLSSHGIGFMHASPIAIGSLVMLCLPRSNGGTLKVLYRVARCDPVNEQQLYVIGAQLDRVLEGAATAPAPPAAA